MNINFKLVKNNDIEYMVALDKQMRVDEPDAYHEYNEKLYRINWEKYPIEDNTRGDVILCLNGEEVVGRVDLMYEQSYMDFSVVGYVDWIYVGPKYRGKGIGKQLLKEAEKQFSNMNCVKYYLFIADNEQAIKFYSSTDFDIGIKKTGSKKL